MTRLLSTLARTVSRVAPGSVPCVLILDGVDHQSRGTWLREMRWTTPRSQDGYESEEQTVVSRLSIPTAGLPRLPENGDEVRVGGEVLYVNTALDLGSTVHVGLTRWRA